jgi:hypothetical protein
MWYEGLHILRSPNAISRKPGMVWTNFATRVGYNSSFYLPNKPSSVIRLRMCCSSEVEAGTNGGKTSGEQISRQ